MKTIIIHASLNNIICYINIILVRLLLRLYTLLPAQLVDILHFNDVYNINEIGDTGGGAARFASAFRQHSKDGAALRLFSGDIFNPSMMSSVVKGEQMIPILEQLRIDCAVFGNHDFDFGVDHLTSLTKKTSFPWLMSNAFDNVTDQPLADGIQYFMAENNGVKVGIMGLIEHDWIETLSTLDVEDVTFIDFVKQADLLSKELRSKGAEFIIALTHMRWPNDRRLAKEAEDIDLILGGHDHDYSIEKVNQRYIIKSGTDFREFSKIRLEKIDNVIDVIIERIRVDNKEYSEDVEVKRIVDEYSKIVDSKMCTLLGDMKVDLEGRFSKVRSEETNLGNFIADIIIKTVEADIALLNSGTLRSDCVHKAGPFRTSTLLSILPMLDPLVVISITGKQLVEALENGVSRYPVLEGRFPIVAGIRFNFDPSKPPYHRILAKSITIQNYPIDMDKTYRLCTKNYLANGKDGYLVFKDCPVLINDEEGPLLSTCVINHFNSIADLLNKRCSFHCHRHSIVSVMRRNSIKREVFTEDEITLKTISDNNNSFSEQIIQMRHMDISSPVPIKQKYLDSSLSCSHSPGSNTLIAPSLHHRPRYNSSAAVLHRRQSIDIVERYEVSGALAPKLDGRISKIID